MKLLFVSRDNGGAKMSVPTARLAVNRGHEVGIVVEGLAGNLFLESGLFGKEYSAAKLLFRGPERPEEVFYALNARDILKKFAPDVVIATRSRPTSIEVMIGLAANECGIPLVLMEDFWAGYRSFPAKPDLILTLDKYAETLIAEFTKTPTVIVGNPTVLEPSSIDRPMGVVARIDALRRQYGKVLLFAGTQPEQSTEQLLLLRDCLECTTSTDWCLIVRSHPTFVNKEMKPGLTWGTHWKNLLARFGDRIVSVDCKSGDVLAVLADATFSGYSLMLNTAAYAGKTAISLWTPRTAKDLKDTVGLDKVPTCELSCAYTVSEPGNLDPCFELPPAHISKLRLRPFNPTIALVAIQNVVKH